MTTNENSQKVVLITGASSGIGEATTRLFAQRKVSELSTHHSFLKTLLYFFQWNPSSFVRLIEKNLNNIENLALSTQF